MGTPCLVPCVSWVVGFTVRTDTLTIRRLANSVACGLLRSTMTLEAPRFFCAGGNPLLSIYCSGRMGTMADIFHLTGRKLKKPEFYCSIILLISLVYTLIAPSVLRTSRYSKSQDGSSASSHVHLEYLKMLICCVTTCKFFFFPRKPHPPWGIGNGSKAT